MNVCRDYEELFKTLNSYNIKYIVVGAYAVIYHSEPRYTKDIDVWIIPEMNDADRVFKALKDFGAPLIGMSPDDFKNKKIIFQMGVAPVRVDIMVDVPGISFEEAWKNRKKVHYGEVPINVLGINDLIKSKKKANRGQDKLDVAILEDRLKRQKKRAKK